MLRFSSLRMISDKKLDIICVLQRFKLKIPVFFEIIKKNKQYIKGKWKITLNSLNQFFTKYFVMVQLKNE